MIDAIWLFFFLYLEYVTLVCIPLPPEPEEGWSCIIKTSNKHCESVFIPGWNSYPALGKNLHKEEKHIRLQSAMITLLLLSASHHFHHLAVTQVIVRGYMSRGFNPPMTTVKNRQSHQILYIISKLQSLVQADYFLYCLWCLIGLPSIFEGIMKVHKHLLMYGGCMHVLSSLPLYPSRKAVWTVVPWRSTLLFSVRENHSLLCRLERIFHDFASLLLCRASLSICTVTCPPIILFSHLSKYQ